MRARLSLASEKLAGLAVLVEKVIPGGAALGHLPDGRAAIVRGALPGDELRIRSWERKPNHVVITAFDLLRGASSRLTPPCVYAASCGACDWMALPFAEQSKWKLELVAEALRRTAGLADWRDKLAYVSAGEPLGYRQRIRLQLDERGRVGYFRAGSRELVPIERCLVADPSLEPALARLREALGAHPTLFLRFEAVELGAAGQAAPVSVHFTPRARPDMPVRGGKARADARKAPPRALESGRSQREWESCRRQLGRDFVVSVAGERPTPMRQYMLTDKLTLLAPPGGFTQVNWAVNRRLVADVVTRVTSQALASFADLYAGSGNFTLPLLAAGLQGSSVERAPAAVRALTQALSLQQLDLDECITGEVAHQIDEWQRRGRCFELVLADPPRSGLPAKLTALSAICRRTLALCSCDPVTLARDLGRLKALGFEIEAITVYDMFPQTHHLEALAWLRAPGTSA